MALAAGQKILDLVPLVVAQGVAVHASASRLPTPHESETKCFGNPRTDDLVLRRFGFSTGRGRRDSAQLTTRPRAHRGPKGYSMLPWGYFFPGWWQGHATPHTDM